MSFRKAERRQAKLRLSLCGPSGSGKTYGAITLAKGIGGKIAMIDTERGSGDLYSDITDYDIVTLSAPFTPARYVDYIAQAEKLKYDILIIDSLSHAWSGAGGILDMHDNAAKSDKSKNSWAAWRTITPQHNDLVDAILQSNLHIIACMRTKTEWTTTEENGKKKPVKIGLAPIQKEGIEYEFTTVLDLIPDTYYFSSSKDRTRIFHNLNDKIKEEHGKKLIQWLDSGKSINDIAEEDANYHIDKIKYSKDETELKEVFIKAFKEFEKDPIRLKRLTDEKDRRKEVLNKVELSKHKDFVDGMDSGQT